MPSNKKNVFSQEQIKFNRLNLQQLKKQELHQIYQILLNQPEMRTIHDLNTLLRIVLTITPIKKLSNYSAVYHLARSMYLARFKQKSFLYQRQEDAQSIYIIINGKIGLFQRSTDPTHPDDVHFLTQGNCFGQGFRWKQHFLPLAFQQTLVAVIPKRQALKILQILQEQRLKVVQALTKSKIFSQFDQLKKISNLFVIHRVPFNGYLIKQGQIPKCLYFLISGSVRKQLQIRQQDHKNINKLKVGYFSAGQYFPKQNLSIGVTYSLVADSPLQVVSIPKRYLKQLGYSYPEYQQKDEKYYKNQIKIQSQWNNFKHKVVVNSVNKTFKGVYFL